MPTDPSQGLTVPAAAQAGGLVTRRLELILDWYRRMISERTGRLIYTYDPEENRVQEDRSPIRDIASVWDVEVLSRFLGRSELDGLVWRSLQHYAGFLTAHPGALILDPQRLGEPSSIAHSAFLLLAFADSGRPDHDAQMRGLADGILGQQRSDGSYRIHFGEEPDHGQEFYPGEAMLALLRAHAVSGALRYLGSVERGFAYYRDRFPTRSVAADLRVFYANWQSQYAVPLEAATSDSGLAAEVREYIFSLHDRIVETGFYEELEQRPQDQATVEVACALEGLNDAYRLAVRAGDAERQHTYERCLRVALAWLLLAQRLERCTERERGGFGHSLSERTQRIDVTGHVASGFIKTVSNGIAA